MQSWITGYLGWKGVFHVFGFLLKKVGLIVTQLTKESRLPAHPRRRPSRLSWYALLAAVVTLMAGGSHADVTHVYVGNSPVGAWNFQRNNACVGIMERQCRFYQRLYPRLREIGVGKSVPVQDFNLLERLLPTLPCQSFPNLCTNNTMSSWRNNYPLSSPFI